MLRLLFFLLLGLFTVTAQAQPTAATASAADYLPWSATRRLNAADFQMVLRANTNMRGSSAVFYFGMDGTVYDLLGKNSNKAIHNSMFRSASWLDTTEASEVSRSIRYQQTLFDIQEIYARRFRQQGRASAWKIVMVGNPDLKSISAQHLKDGQQRQVDYTEQTAYGTIEQAQQVWEQRIKQELQELQAFQLTD